MHLFYVHFPKAGGTSFQRQLLAHWPNRTLMDYQHDPIAGGNVREPGYPAEEICCVMGHLHPARYADWATLMFTVLREPIDNLISIYAFWQDFPSTGNPVHDRFLAERPTILEFAETYPVRTLMSESYFGGFDVGRFDYVGFFDRREQTARVLSTIIGKPIAADLHLNQTPDRHAVARGEIVADHRLMSRLRDVLQEDIRFYETMRVRWG